MVLSLTKLQLLIVVNTLCTLHATNSLSIYISKWFLEDSTSYPQIHTFKMPLSYRTKPFHIPVEYL